MNKVIIIGGGAAGLMAAVAAILYNNDVTIYDGNEQVGKKIYITGKGRCNLTNNSDEETSLFFKYIERCDINE